MAEECQLRGIAGISLGFVVSGEDSPDDIRMQFDVEGQGYLLDNMRASTQWITEIKSNGGSNDLSV
ncbi:MAG: hypothetical protein M2R45_01064 [Verrucomicrobia subdivision 3 bacterium]|nr:hypothetical protein [Limisphaerales bacterium]MCS1414175.1 hypothetical protein [Limisphaerales bacterium]